MGNEVDKRGYSQKNKKKKDFAIKRRVNLYRCKFS